MQKQYVEKPYKVLAEQFDAAAAPLQAGVCVCADRNLGTDGRPHVHAARGFLVLAAGDWIVQDAWHAWAFDVIPDSEFSERFGGQGPPVLEG